MADYTKLHVHKNAKCGLPYLITVNSPIMVFKKQKKIQNKCCCFFIN